MSREELLDANMILDRLKTVLEIETDTKLAQVFDLKQSSLASWRSRNSPNHSKIIALCNERGISLDWLYAVEVEGSEAQARAKAARSEKLETENQRLHEKVTSLKGKIEGLREALRLTGRRESERPRRGEQETGFTATEGAEAGGGEG